ncbi:MAG: hypothetical protein ACLUTA_08980 [Blautia wexlerae]
MTKKMARATMNSDDQDHPSVPVHANGISDLIWPKQLTSSHALAAASHPDSVQEQPAPSTWLLYDHNQLTSSPLKHGTDHGLKAMSSLLLCDTYPLLS